MNALFGSKTKGLLTSRTFWFNIIGGALTVALEGLAPTISDPSTSAIAMTIGNVILRKLTKEAI